MSSLTIAELVAQSHGLAKEKGWWPDEPFNIPEKLALIHSEISEALEDYRTADPECLSEVFMYDKKPVGFAVELADAVIRIADLCGKMGIDLEKVIQTKHAYNMGRPFRHGGKKA